MHLGLESCPVSLHDVNALALGAVRVDFSVLWAAVAAILHSVHAGSAATSNGTQVNFVLDGASANERLVQEGSAVIGHILQRHKIVHRNGDFHISCDL